ncbi:MAG: hypothetical protein NXI16_14125 [Alphaproteobacteria bacterium]|nr:hypothetical protein [Alphaproteobacteria bacterium]
MKRGRFSEEQMIGVLRGNKAGESRRQAEDLAINANLLVGEVRNFLDGASSRATRDQIKRVSVDLATCLTAVDDPIRSESAQRPDAYSLYVSVP